MTKSKSKGGEGCKDGDERDYQRDLVMAHLDPEFEDKTIETVEEAKRDDPGTRRAWSASFVEGLSFLIRDEHGVARTPERGDRVRLFGKGFGFPVRGVALLGEGGGLLWGNRDYANDEAVERAKDASRCSVVAVYRYRSRKEQETEHAAWVAAEKRERREKWEARKCETATDVAALPSIFRERFEFFMRTPGWGPEFGPYELFVMKEAVKIADVKVKGVRGPDAVEAFAALGWEEQKALLPSLGDGHSGNTFGAACALARCYLTEPALVPKMHGALCPLVGCEEYGCWSRTPEARASREARGSRGTRVWVREEEDGGEDGGGRS